MIKRQRILEKKKYYKRVFHILFIIALEVHLYIETSFFFQLLNIYTHSQFNIEII